jgi:hypothetical protein
MTILRTKTYVHFKPHLTDIWLGKAVTLPIIWGTDEHIDAQYTSRKYDADNRL